MAETDGIMQVGTVTVIRRRDSTVEENYTEALRSGARTAYAEASIFAQGLIDAAPPYTDTRSLQTMLDWLADRILQA